MPRGTRQPSTPLGVLLRDLRKAAGLTEKGAAALLEVSQSAVNRWEMGDSRPSPEAATKAARKYNASDEDKAEVQRLADVEQGASTTPARVVLTRDGAAMQRRWGRLERAASRIDEFEPNVITGLLQTERYARAVFQFGGMAPGDIDEATRERLARQDVLDDDARTFTLIHGEGALRWHLDGPEAMAEQCQRLADETRPNVRLGLIPWDRPVPAVSLNGFYLFDDSDLVLSNLVGTTFIDGRADEHAPDVSLHVELFGALTAAAVFGDEARERFADMADSYRRLV